MREETNEKVTEALKSSSLTQNDKAILRVISQHRGAGSAIRSADIVRHVGLAQGEHARRRITKTVETLVLHFRIPIGALRVHPYGYFLIESKFDLELAVAARWGEVYAHLKFLRVLSSREEVSRLFDQGMLNFDGAPAGAVEAASR